MDNANGYWSRTATLLDGRQYAVVRCIRGGGVFETEYELATHDLTRFYVAKSQIKSITRKWVNQ